MFTIPEHLISPLVYIASDITFCRFIGSLVWFLANIFPFIKLFLLLLLIWTKYKIERLFICDTFIIIVFPQVMNINTNSQRVEPTAPQIQDNYYDELNVNEVNKMVSDYSTVVPKTVK